jgi:hypothetical protein
MSPDDRALHPKAARAKKIESGVATFLGLPHDCTRHLRADVERLDARHRPGPRLDAQRLPPGDLRKVARYERIQQPDRPMKPLRRVGPKGPTVR